MKYSDINKLNQYVKKKVGTVHPHDLDVLFLEGGFARGSATRWSDIDYTACVSDKITHPKFLFEFVNLAGTKRVLSVFFYQTEKEILIPKQEMGDDHYLWIKDMMANSAFVGGKRETYDKIVTLYKGLEYSHSPRPREVHKCTGKAIELFLHAKKCQDRGRLREMIYYGQKVAEKCRGLVAEFNEPLHLGSETDYLEGNFKLPDKPNSFVRLYSEVNRFSLGAISEEEYIKQCRELVIATMEFLLERKNKLDVYTKSFLKGSEWKQFIKNI